MTYTTERAEKEALKLYKSELGCTHQQAIEAYVRDWNLSGISKSLAFAQKVNQAGHVLNLKTKKSLLKKYIFMCKKSILLSLLLVLSVVTAKAQYYSINIDYETMAVMSEAFTTEAAMEALHKENLQKIYDSYTAAEVASAGIFSSKYLDRQALTSLNLWNDKDENYYYTRIYNIVSKRIIPKIIVCAKLMVEDPSTALYWGSYLVKTCDDVKSLCQQFESVVTNSTLSFKDIAFVQITDELKDIFNLSKLAVSIGRTSSSIWATTSRERSPKKA